MKILVRKLWNREAYNINAAFHSLCENKKFFYDSQLQNRSSFFLKIVLSLKTRFFFIAIMLYKEQRLLNQDKNLNWRGKKNI